MLSRALYTKCIECLQIWCDRIKNVCRRLRKIIIWTLQRPSVAITLLLRKKPLQSRIFFCMTVLNESRSVFCFFPARSYYETDGHQHNLGIYSPNCGTSFLFRNFWRPGWILNSISSSHKNMVRVICFSKMPLSTLFLQLTWAIRKSLENLSFSWQNQCLIVHLQVKSNSSFWVREKCKAVGSFLCTDMALCFTLTLEGISTQPC